MKLSDPRFLAVYSGSVTAALLVLLLSGSSPAKRKTSFDEIDVKRINVVEPDGTLRMVISDKARFPGWIMKGQEHPSDRKTTGLLFFNEEGTENGGLIFGGYKGPDGKVAAGGSLTFDQYEQDQVIQMVQSEDNGSRTAGLKVNDAPDLPIDFGASAKLSAKIAGMKDGPEKEAELENYRKLYGLKNRIFMGKSSDHSASLVLRDQQARKRIVLEVAPDGTPSMKFLDEKGQVISKFPPESRGPEAPAAGS